MSEPLAIEVEDVVRAFGAVRAVDGVSLRIEPGEVVALLGPNGAGKTSTIDMILGLAQPDSGRVRVCGLPPHAAATAGRVGAVMQTGGLLGDLTVHETVEVVGALFHTPAQRVSEVMESTDLTPLSRRRVGRCSGGEQQRLRFAMALLPDPDVLVLDEPTAGMDVTARRRFWEVMKKDAAAGRTIVFATHYLEEAQQFAARTIVLDHGHVVADGATATLRESLGKRTIIASLAPGTEDEVLARLRRDPSVQSAAIVDGRLRVSTAASDALLTPLLSAGAHDIEVEAPSLEDAFTTLTEG